MPYSKLGIIYQSQKQNKLAIRNYQKALDLNPDSIVAYNNLAGLTMEEGGNLDKALALAQKAKEKAPDNIPVSDTLAWIYYKKKLYTRAISLLEECRKQSEGKLPDILYHLGMAYYKNGDKEKAIKTLQQFLSQGTDSDTPEAKEAQKAVESLS